MSEKKSLGSSPIGYKSKNDSKMGFIPDVESSKTLKEKPLPKKEGKKSTKKNSEPAKTKKEKEVVSYSLEKDLIADIKSTATERKIYYSTLVSKALKKWFAENT